MNKITLSLVALLASVSLFGSATIISGGWEAITFQSVPEGATISINGVKSCDTPCGVPLQRAFFEKTITVSKPGYETVTVPMTNSYDPVTLLNVFWDFSTTDMGTGAAWNYSPNNYLFELKPVK